MKLYACLIIPLLTLYITKTNGNETNKTEKSEKANSPPISLSTESKKEPYTIEKKPTELEEFKINSCLSKRSNFCLFGDFLYFKALEDSLNYAEKIPQNATFTPKVKNVSQRFDYEPGFRTGVAYHSNLWEFNISWMHYDITPPSRKVSDKDFGLLATLATPVWGALGNVLVNKAKGSWKLEINAVDALLQRTFCFKSFSFAPSSGIKFGLVEQKIRVHYRDFQMEFPSVVSPGKIKGESSFWGVGPTLGMQIHYFLSEKFNIFFNGCFSCLIGDFNTKTLYQEFEPPVTPSDSEIKIKNSETRISMVNQIQAGIEKKWTGKNSFIEVSLGWEVQVWQKQMRLNYFSTFVSPPSGSDLSLYGPYFRAKIGF